MSLCDFLSLNGEPAPYIDFKGQFWYYFRMLCFFWQQSSKSGHSNVIGHSGTSLEPGGQEGFGTHLVTFSLLKALFLLADPGVARGLLYNHLRHSLIK